jgi:hypothetical protein
VPGFDYLGRALIALGAIAIVLGLLLFGLGKLFGGGRLLPGDIVIQRPGFTFVFPIVTGLLLSALLSAILWLIFAWRR